MQERHRAGAARLLAGLLQEGERHGGLDLVRVVRLKGANIRGA